jgi:O-antigen ligase
MSLIRPEIVAKVYHMLMSLLVFSIPLHKTFSSSVIMLMGLFWLVESSPGKKFNRLVRSRETNYIIGFSLLYIVYFIGAFYSEGLFSNRETLFNLQVKASLLIFPVFFATFEFEGFKPDFFKKLMTMFVAGCLVSSVIILGNAVYQFFSYTQSTGVFFYSHLAMRHHPSYLSLIFSIAIAVLMVRLVIDPNLSGKRRIVASFLVLYFQVFIVLLSSKAGIIGLVFLYAGIVMFVGFKIKTRLKETVYLSVIMITGFFILLALNPSVRERFLVTQKALKTRNEIRTDTLESSVARLIIWKSALEIIHGNPVFGVGTGDVREELVKKYREKKIIPAIENEYNAHNQYLQTYLAVGIPGLLVLLGCLVIAFIAAIKSGNLLYFLFTLLFSFHILVESMLERQAGVIFYAFFNALLFYITITGKNQSGFKLSQI